MCVWNVGMTLLRASHDCFRTCCCLRAYPASLPLVRQAIGPCRTGRRSKPLSASGRWLLLLLAPHNTQPLVAEVGGRPMVRGYIDEG
jgi:hypothetical protein